MTAAIARDPPGGRRPRGTPPATHTAKKTQQIQAPKENTQPTERSSSAALRTPIVFHVLARHNLVSRRNGRGTRAHCSATRQWGPTATTTRAPTQRWRRGRTRRRQTRTSGAGAAAPGRRVPPGAPTKSAANHAGRGGAAGPQAHRRQADADRPTAPADGCGQPRVCRNADAHPVAAARAAAWKAGPMQAREGRSERGGGASVPPRAGRVESVGRGARTLGAPRTMRTVAACGGSAACGVSSRAAPTPPLPRTRWRDGGAVAWPGVGEWRRGSVPSRVCDWGATRCKHEGPRLRMQTLGPGGAWASPKSESSPDDGERMAEDDVVRARQPALGTWVSNAPIGSWRLSSMVPLVPVGGWAHGLQQTV